MAGLDSSGGDQVGHAAEAVAATRSWQCSRQHRNRFPKQRVNRVAAQLKRRATQLKRRAPKLRRQVGAKLRTLQRDVQAVVNLLELAPAGVADALPRLQCPTHNRRSENGQKRRATTERQARMHCHACVSSAVGTSSGSSTVANNSAPLNSSSAGGTLNTSDCRRAACNRVQHLTAAVEQRTPTTQQPAACSTQQPQPAPAGTRAGRSAAPSPPHAPAAAGGQQKSMRDTRRCALHKGCCLNHL